MKIERGLCQADREGKPSDLRRKKNGQRISFQAFRFFIKGRSAIISSVIIQYFNDLKENGVNILGGIFV